MTTSVSVALCTHNGRPYLREQLASIITQHRAVDEVVLSDDASTDGTVELVRAFWPPAGPRLRILRNVRPLGVTANFEQAMAACSGDLIVLSDQDDVWLPHRVERALATFHDDPSLLLLFADAELIDESGAALGSSLWESLEIVGRDLAAIAEGRAFDTLIRRNLATGATVVVRRELVELARPFPQSWLHDEWLAILAASHEAIAWDERAAIRYRQHGANQIGASKPTLRRKLRRIAEPRGSRNATLATRAQVLVERLKAIGASENTVRTAEGKAAHETARAGLPGARLRRIGPVVRALKNGSYDQYSSRGRLDIVRDLLQPER